MSVCHPPAVGTATAKTTREAIVNLIHSFLAVEAGAIVNVDTHENLARTIFEVIYTDGSTLVAHLSEHPPGTPPLFSGANMKTPG